MGPLYVENGLHEECVTIAPKLLRVNSKSLLTSLISIRKYTNMFRRLRFICRFSVGNRGLTCKQQTSQTPIFGKACYAFRGDGYFRYDKILTLHDYAASRDIFLQYIYCKLGDMNDQCRVNCNVFVSWRVILRIGIHFRPLKRSQRLIMKISGAECILLVEGCRKQALLFGLLRYQPYHEFMQCIHGVRMIERFWVRFLLQY